MGKARISSLYRCLCVVLQPDDCFYLQVGFCAFWLADELAAILALHPNATTAVHMTKSIELQSRIGK